MNEYFLQEDLQQAFFDELDKFAARESEGRSSLFDFERPLPQGATTNIRQDSYDIGAFDRLVDSSSELNSLTKSGEKTIGETWPELVRDIWASFFKPRPELVPEEEMDSSHLANRPFIEKLLTDPEAQKVRASTVLDETGAALATLVAGNKMFSELIQREEINKHYKNASKGNEESLNALENAIQATRMIVKNSLAQAGQELERAQQALIQWGIGEADLQTVPIDERIRIIQRLSSGRMRELADLVGRFRSLARTRQRQKIAKERDELYSITVGKDLAYTLPSELAMLRHPMRRLDFYRRYTEGQLLQYELVRKERLGRGPIVAMIDCSGSMMGPRMDWATAVALALFDTARRQKRKVAVVFFNSRIVYKANLDPKDTKNPKTLLEIASVGAGGGTDYDPPIQWAISTIENVGFKKADMVMITDGECRLSKELRERLLEKKGQLGFRVWTIQIASTNMISEELQSWSDRVWAVNSLTDELAGDLLEEVY